MKRMLFTLCMIASVMAFAQTPTIKYQFDNLGTTSTNGVGLWFANTTPAASGVQQVSPSLVLEGQGWKTTATAGSQSVKFMEDVLPVQGTTNPTGSWRLRASINNGAYSATPIIQAFSDGNVLIGGSALTAGSVLLDLQSTTRGLLVPRVTNIASITTPVNGMVAYDAATNLFNFRQNGAWVTLGGAPGGATGDIQYNNSGVFGGFGDYNSTYDRMTASGMVRSQSTYIPFQAQDAGTSSYQGIVNWGSAFINNFGASTQGINIFSGDSGDLNDRSAIVEYNVMLTKPDGSDSCIKKILVAYRKDGTAAPVQVGSSVVLLAVGNTTPTVTFNVLSLPQINIASNGSGDWNIKVWAHVSVSN